MLNELRELATSLKNADITPPDLHPKFVALKKSAAAYWVYLDRAGVVSGISKIPADKIPTIKKWDGIGSNGISFPTFNVPPLLKVETDDDKKKLADIKSSIKKGKNSSGDIGKIIEVSTNLWIDKFGKKYSAEDNINKCLTVPIQDLQKKLTDIPRKFSAISNLLDIASNINAKQLHEQLVSHFTLLIQDNDAEAIESLFYYSGQKPTYFQLVFDVDGNNEYPANHQEVQRWMNHKFLLSDTQDIHSDLDAFGCNASGKDSKFPRVGFKNALGNVILRAMSDEVPCQHRYGMINFHSFPAGEQVRKDMKSALEWLGGEERKGKTWCDLSRRMGRSMLLFAYPSVIPQDLPDLAGMMGNAEEEETETDQAQFALLAEKVTLALSGRTNETICSEIRVFVLSKKKGDARTKVMASSRYSAKHVIWSAQNWQEGCQNLPDIAVKCFGKSKGDNLVWNKPLIPFPAEVIWSLNTVWMIGRDDNGERYSRAKDGHGFSVNDVLCLLLGEGVELQQLASRALGSAIRNSTSLLLAIGQANVQGLVHKTDRNYSKQTLLLPSILGLLLLKLRHKKGEIMTSPAFLVGRLLSLADSLHLEYCKHVRNNSIPPQLVGNALMTTAQEEPVKALSMLWGRIKPYHSWAQTLKDGYFLKHLGEVSEQLANVQLPQRCMDTDKAQMLLGYLARVKQD